MKISVVIPAYNYGHFIERTLSSLWQQSYKDFEIVIIDDCGTDNTFDIVNKNQDSRIRYFKNRKNCGIQKTVNRGLLLAKGDYICILAADDILPPNSLQVRLSALQLFKVDFVLGGITIIENGSSRYIHPVDINNLTDVYHFLCHHPVQHGINNATCMFNRSVLQTIGLRKENRVAGNHADYEYVLKLIVSCKGVSIDESCYTYLKHTQSMSSITSGQKSHELLLNLESTYATIVHSKLIP